MAMDPVRKQALIKVGITIGLLAGAIWLGSYLWKSSESSEEEESPDDSEEEAPLS